MSEVHTQAIGDPGRTGDAPVASVPAAAPPRKPRKAGCGCLLPMLALLTVLGFAPQIVTQTRLRHQVPGWLIPGLPPGVVIGSASAGWTSPIQLNDIVIPDDQGRPSLRAKHVTLSRSIWDFAQSTDDLGLIAIEQPVLHVYIDGGRTNYDQVLKRLSANTQSRGRRSLIDLQLTGGEITIREEYRTEPATDTAATVQAQNAVPVAGLPAISPDAPRSVFTSETPPLGQVIAVIDLQQATLKSQAAGSEEFVGELTAVLREPAVEQPLTGELRWDLPDAPSTGIGSGKLKLVVPSVPLTVLSPWLTPLTAEREVSGEISLKAMAEVIPSGEGLLLAARLDVPHLDVRLSPGAAQAEPFRWVGDDLQIAVEGQGDLLGMQLTIETAQLRTPIINADFAGTMADLPGASVCDLSGTCDLNPADLLASLPDAWADKIQVNGLKLGQIRIVGALRPAVPAATHESPEIAAVAPLRVSAELQWTAANVMGFKSENAIVQLDWSERQLSLNPNRLPIGQGRWVASPRIEFAPDGRWLVFDGGPVFEDVDFTQEMSDTWLRYVSPLLGSSTSIEGKFSLSASPARVELTPPYEGRLEGILDIQSAQVGPGPLTRQILGAVAGLQTILGRKPAANTQWMLVNEQQVPFAFAEGRVSHQDLQVGFGDLIVTSEGSVGLDESIDFQLSIPIPVKWIEGQPLLENLKGEVIPLPIRGTLDQPQLDGKALGDFGKRIGIKSAGGLIQQLIEKRLEQKANGVQKPKPRPPRSR